MIVSAKILILIEIVMLFFAGLTIGTSIQTLEGIKNEMMKNPEANYNAPLTGVELPLDEAWDMIRFYVYACFVLVCFIAIHLGSLIVRVLP